VVFEAELVEFQVRKFSETMRALSSGDPSFLDAVI